jgi:molecular chaperone HscB
MYCLLYQLVILRQLQLHGHALAEGDIHIDPGFLAEIMEVNEEVVEAESPSDLSGISEANKTVLKDYVESVSKAFREDRLKDAKSLVTKMKYYSNIQDKIIEKETAFGIV